MRIYDKNLTLLAWANDDWNHEPDLILPVEIPPENVRTVDANHHKYKMGKTPKKTKRRHLAL